MIDKIVNMINSDGMSRLTIEIDSEQHRQINTLATFAGMTIKEFILAKTLGDDVGAEPETTDRLLSSPENAKRLLEAIATPASKRRVFATIEELEDALGIQSPSL